MFQLFFNIATTKFNICRIVDQLCILCGVLCLCEWNKRVTTSCSSSFPKTLTGTGNFGGAKNVKIAGSKIRAVEARSKNPQPKSVKIAAVHRAE
ncbi:hypothetical protein TNIN_10701 [Trichonephila inaurata madagascariensis]|uniref:Uncharacterized protein n=1 Tax=Trichonephila inaurata madagascariensis TaxID=2747483 RepID=A0A8X6YXF1_9ARAC|nr:hypothetical protein TNIN_10701 [Trichonephila inaurata madagascariensis]